jgi:hypothetical protein
LIAINENTTLTVVVIEMKAAINANNECDQWKGKRRTAAQRKYRHVAALSKNCGKGHTLGQTDGLQKRSSRSE